MVIPVYTTILGAIILFRLDGKVKKKSLTCTEFLFIWGFILPAFTKYLQNEIILFWNLANGRLPSKKKTLTKSLFVDK